MVIEFIATVPTVDLYLQRLLRGRQIEKSNVNTQSKASIRARRFVAVLSPAASLAGVVGGCSGALEAIRACHGVTPANHGGHAHRMARQPHHLRDVRTRPRWRGVAPLHELDAAGISVAVASDNTRDPFYAYGDLDMLEVFREATRILQLDHSSRPWTRLLGPAPASIMGISCTGCIAVGGPADLVVTGARTLGELLSRPWSDRTVVVGGKTVERRLPDYSELDRITG